MPKRDKSIAKLSPTAIGFLGESALVDSLVQSGVRCYRTLIDDHGVDLYASLGGRLEIAVQAKACTETPYVYFRDRDTPIGPKMYIGMVLRTKSTGSECFLIPTERWILPDRFFTRKHDAIGSYLAISTGRAMLDLLRTHYSLHAMIQTLAAATESPYRSLEDMSREMEMHDELIEQEQQLRHRWTRKSTSCPEAELAFLRRAAIRANWPTQLSLWADRARRWSDTTGFACVTERP